jgi:hypothetical protein
VAVAVRTLTCVRDKVSVAVAEELAKVPLSPVLMALVGVPLWGVAVTWIVVPRGMLLAVRVTGTGLVVPTGRRMSGAARMLPTGVAGAASPPTLAITRLGFPLGGKTAWGRLVVEAGKVDPL